MLLELISLDKTDVYSYRESDELKRPHENSYSRSLVEQAFVFLRDWLSSSYRRLQSAIQKLFLLTSVFPPSIISLHTIPAEGKQAKLNWERL